MKAYDHGTDVVSDLTPVFDYWNPSLDHHKMEGYCKSSSEQ